MPNQSELQNNLIKLEDCCSFNPRANKDSLSKECSFIPMSAVSENGLVDLSNSLSAQDPKKGFSYFENGDVLFAKITPCMENGKGAIVDNLLNGFGFGSTEFHVIRANSNVILPEWVYFLTKSDNFRKKAESAMTGSAGQKRVPLTFLKNYRISLPSLQEQKNNSKILFKIQKIQMHLENLLNILDLSIKSRFVEMFDDCNLSLNKSNWVQLKDIAEIVGGATPKTSVEKYWNGTLPWITPAEISDDKMFIDSCNRYLTQEGVDSCSLKPVPKGTILLTSRAPIGKLAIALVPLYCNQGFKNIVCGSKLNNIYLYYLFKMNVDYLNSLGRGSTFNEISKSIVEKILIPLPDYDRQVAFSGMVKQINKSKFAIQKSIEKLEILKKSLMQEYFG